MTVHCIACTFEVVGGEETRWGLDGVFGMVLSLEISNVFYDYWLRCIRSSGKKERGMESERGN